MRKDKKKLSKFAAITIIIAAIAAILPAQISNSKTNVSNDSDKAIHLTDTNFSKTIKNGVTVVDFWATWCGPCRIQGPIIDDVAKEIGKKATIAKLDVDKNRATSSKYNVRNIPTIIIFKNGVPVKRLIGVQQKQTLINVINSYL